MVKALLCILVSCFATVAWAENPRFSSGDRQVSLIELYSSEGCSSCPPADRWVAGLKNNDRLWKDFVPLNFHVDYWNRLGWVDRFSNQSFTQRQRRFAAEWGSGRVYTPGFVKNGEEWRSRQLSHLVGATVGELVAEPLGDDRYKVTFRPKRAGRQKYEVHLALLGHGLSTEVKYGENAGETLHHEFVVLKKNSKPMEGKKGAYQAVVEIPKNQKAGARKFSLAVWVSSSGSQKPLQATGGYLTSFNN